MEKNGKRTPLFDWHQGHGGQMVSFGGWEMPLNYGPGIIEEHLATRRRGGLFDTSHMGRFYIRGRGVIPFLQHVLTNNAATLGSGNAQYTFIANEHGGAIDDAYLYRLNGEEYLLVVNASNTLQDWTWLNEQAGKFPDLVLEDWTARLAMVALQGPAAKATLEKVLDKDRSRLPDPGRNQLRPAWITGVACTVSRTGYTGEPLGFEIFIPAEKGALLWEALLAAGEDAGIFPVGLGARDTLRLEAGLPLFGHELGLDPEGREIPVFAISQAKGAVSFCPDKGEYIGREALFRQFRELQLRAEGRLEAATEELFVPRRIYPLKISGGVARPHFPVFAGENPAGFVTSGTMVPYWKFQGTGILSRLGEEKGRRAIALAYLDAALPFGQPVRILSRGKFLPGLVVKRNLSSEAAPYARPILEEPAPRKPLPSPPFQEAVRTLVQRAKENTIWRSRRTINLIPSEQTPSPLVKLLSIADPCARYAEHRNFPFLGAEDIYYYQGTGFIQQVEEALQAEMGKYLGCSQVETRIISGQMANAAVFSGLMDFLNRFDRKSAPRRLRRVMTHHLGRGGHLSSQPMGALRDCLGVDSRTERPAVTPFPVREDNPYQIDLPRTEALLGECRPELLVLGKSLILHREPVRDLRRLADGLRERPLILYDAAHVLGLLGPFYQKPFEEGADLVTGSTHKTFFGTQRGIIAGDFSDDSPLNDLWLSITRRTFPGSLSNHHLGTLLGLLLASWEMNAFAPSYQSQVIRNAQAFARALRETGLQVEGDPSIGYTETHQVVLRVGYGRGAEMAHRLERNGIIVNYQALPDDEGFTASSGLRLGVQEMTRFGMVEEDFQSLAEILGKVILEDRPMEEEAARLRSRFLTLRFCLPEEEAEPLVRELLPAVLGV
ncbi:MAG: glycine cleavage system aminomethyltransferase GcvT [Deltaproteobacteria bacterium]|nr:glycine cleavage system aminomethyltransferase GcvT [Deltaproteobacteria bacterium]